MTNSSDAVDKIILEINRRMNNSERKRAKSHSTDSWHFFNGAYCELSDLKANLKLWKDTCLS